MNDFAKLKSRKSSRLGTPPPADEVKNNLKAPETAPEMATEPPKAKVAPREAPQQDRRSARATGRTEPFATRVKEGIRQDYKLTAAKQGITMGKLLEDALAIYKKHHKI